MADLSPSDAQLVKLGLKVRHCDVCDCVDVTSPAEGRYIFSSANKAAEPIALCYVHTDQFERWGAGGKLAGRVEKTGTNDESKGTKP